MADERNASSSPGLPVDIDGVDISISGIHEENEMAKDAARREVIDSVSRLGRFADVTMFRVNVKKSDAEGSRARFDVNLMVTADGRDFHADGTEWDLPKAVRAAIDKMERAVSKEEDKEKSYS